MKYYIVKEENENKIVKVEEIKVMSFKKEYAEKIMFEAGSLAELLIMFSNNHDITNSIPMNNN